MLSGRILQAFPTFGGIPRGTGDPCFVVNRDDTGQAEKEQATPAPRDRTFAQASCRIDTRGMRQVTAGYHPAMGLGRFLNPERLAGRFNQWFGATAMAAKAERGGAYGQAVDPSAVVGVIGEIEGQYGGSDARREDADLPPMNFEPLKHHEATPRSDETARSDK